jgi:tRNA modification GTPase
MDNIFAPATIIGKSAVSIIRISGPEAYLTLESLGVKAQVKPRVAVLGKIFTSAGEMIDQVLMLWFPAPDSFTGENVLEIQMHGSRAVVSMVIIELSAIKGFRMAEPGEFTSRALANNKIDLVQAEGLADLINAETAAQAKQASRQISGELTALYYSWRNVLIKILASVEAEIDFADEGIPADLKEKFFVEIAKLEQNIRRHLDDNRAGEMLRAGFYITIIGAPNAGKSSLLNFLARREVAIVSEYAGTTRDIVEVHLDIQGYPVIVADTAGLRTAGDPVEQEGIERAMSRAESADLIIALFDINKLPDFDGFTSNLLKKNSILVASKADMAQDWQEKFCQEKGLLPISVYNQRGIDSLFNLIAQQTQERFTVSADPIITRERYRTALKSALVYIEKLDFDMPVELLAEKLKAAARHIGGITKKIDVEDILNELFANFCIGK